MNTKELRRKAVGILNEYGWHQGDYFDPDTGGCCITGALMLAADVDAYDLLEEDGQGVQIPQVVKQAAHEITVELDACISEDVTGLVTWNDDYGRNKLEVLAALEPIYMLCELLV